MATSGTAPIQLSLGFEIPSNKIEETFPLHICVDTKSDVCNSKQNKPPPGAACKVAEHPRITELKKESKCRIPKPSSSKTCPGQDGQGGRTFTVTASHSGGTKETTIPSRKECPKHPQKRPECPRQPQPQCPQQKTQECPRSKRQECPPQKNEARALECPKLHPSQGAIPKVRPQSNTTFTISKQTCPRAGTAREPCPPPQEKKKPESSDSRCNTCYPPKKPSIFSLLSINELSLESTEPLMSSSCPSPSPPVTPDISAINADLGLPGVASSTPVAEGKERTPGDISSIANQVTISETIKSIVQDHVKKLEDELKSIRQTEGEIDQEADPLQKIRQCGAEPDQYLKPLKDSLRIMLNIYKTCTRNQYKKFNELHQISNKVVPWLKNLIAEMKQDINTMDLVIKQIHELQEKAACGQDISTCVKEELDKTEEKITKVRKDYQEAVDNLTQYIQIGDKPELAVYIVTKGAKLLDKLNDWGNYIIKHYVYLNSLMG